jgi:hypothetical protein
MIERFSSFQYCFEVNQYLNANEKPEALLKL